MDYFGFFFVIFLLSTLPLFSGTLAAGLDAIFLLGGGGALFLAVVGFLTSAEGFLAFDSFDLSAFSGFGFPCAAGFDAGPDLGPLVPLAFAGAAGLDSEALAGAVALAGGAGFLAAFVLMTASEALPVATFESTTFFAALAVVFLLSAVEASDALPFDVPVLSLDAAPSAAPLPLVAAGPFGGSAAFLAGLGGGGGGGGLWLRINPTFLEECEGRCRLRIDFELGRELVEQGSELRTFGLGDGSLQSWNLTFLRFLRRHHLKQLEHIHGCLIDRNRMATESILRDEADHKLRHARPSFHVGHGFAQVGFPQFIEIERIAMLKQSL